MGLFGKNVSPPTDPHERLAAAKAGMARADAIMDASDGESRRYKKAWRDRLACVAEHDAAQVALGNPDECLTPIVVEGHIAGSAFGAIVGAMGIDAWDRMDPEAKAEIDAAAAEVKTVLVMAIELGELTESADFIQVMKEQGVY